MITNETYFFKNQSSVSISDPLYNVNDGVLILQVDGNASNLELSVLGNTDLIDDDFIALKTINATDYSMSDKITSTGIYWIDINGIRKVKLNLSKITGSVNVKALTKRGLTTDLVARAMAANASSSSSYTLPIASADTLGGIKIGDNLSIDENGVVSAKGGESIYEIRPKDLHLIDYMDEALVGEQITRMFTDGVEDPILRVRPTDVARVNINYYDFKLGRTDYPFSKKTQYNFMINPITYISGAPIQVWNTYLRIAYISISGSWDSDNKFTCNSIRYNTVFSETVENITTDNKVLTKTNTTSFAPTENYHPATKKYVDDKTGDLTTLATEDKTSLVNAINEVASGLKIFELFIDNELVYFNKITGDDLTVISDFINYCKDNNGMAMLCLRFKNETVLFRLLTNYTSGSVIDIYSITPIANSNLLKTIKLSVSGTYADNKFTATNVTKYLVESNYAYVNNFLAKNNTTSYTPTSDYNPATKKYVDDAIASAITTSLEASY